MPRIVALTISAWLGGSWPARRCAYRLPAMRREMLEGLAPRLASQARNAARAAGVAGSAAMLRAAHHFLNVRKSERYARRVASDFSARANLSARASSSAGGSAAGGECVVSERVGSLVPSLAPIIGIIGGDLAPWRKLGDFCSSGPECQFFGERRNGRDWDSRPLAPRAQGDLRATARPSAGGNSVCRL